MYVTLCVTVQIGNELSIKMEPLSTTTTGGATVPYNDATAQILSQHFTESLLTGATAVQTEMVEVSEDNPLYMCGLCSRIMSTLEEAQAHALLDHQSDCTDVNDGQTELVLENLDAVNSLMSS